MIKNYITINQGNFIKIGELRNIKVDAVDGVLFDWIHTFTNSEKALKKLINNKLYIWVSYKAIREDNPLAHINTNDVVGRRLNKLIKLGLLEKYFSKEDGSKTFFHITEFAYKYLLEGVRLESSTLPTQKSEGIRLESSTLPTQKSDNSKLIDSYNSKKNKEFSFTLPKKMEIVNLPEKYINRLKEYINSEKKTITFKDFYDACASNGYKYINFKIAYDRWVLNLKRKKSSPKNTRTSCFKSVQEKNEEFINSISDKYFAKQEFIDAEVVR